MTEARSTDNDEFGRDRLLAAVQQCHGLKSEAMLDLLLSAVNRFAAGAPQADDITALVLRYKGPDRTTGSTSERGVGPS